MARTAKQIAASRANLAKARKKRGAFKSTMPSANRKKWAATLKGRNQSIGGKEWMFKEGTGRWPTAAEAKKLNSLGNFGTAKEARAVYRKARKKRKAKKT